MASRLPPALRVRDRRRKRPLPPEIPRAIRKARVAAGLTQQHLGRYLALKGRAVSRWELAQGLPAKHNRADLVRVIGTRHPGAALELATVFATHLGDAPPPAPPASARVPTEAASRDTFDLAVLRLADELDLPARRLRRPLARLFDRIAAAQLDLDGAREHLKRWIGEE